MPQFPNDAGRMTKRFLLFTACSLTLAFALAEQADAKSTSQPMSSRRTAAASRSARPSPGPYEIGRFAKPTYGPAYGYGWVGGGAPSWRGQPRRRDEGVWGRDYVGVFYLRRVWPNWWHGARQQGGAGAYKPDGPKLIGH